MDADLLLVGGGHAHLHVLERLARRADRAHKVVLVTDDRTSVYSGMVPGVVSGRYLPDAARLPVAALARRGGVDLRVGEVESVDPRHRRVRLLDGTSISFQFLSLNVGATVQGLDLPGVREYALPTRPIGCFVTRLTERLRDPRRCPEWVVVVGGGAGGVELAFAVREGAAVLGRRPGISLVHGGQEILDGAPPEVVRRVRRRAGRRDIEVKCGRRVAAVEEGAVLLEDGERVPADVVIWATGAQGHPFLRSSGLDTDGRGFVRVRPTLQLLDFDHIFAAGDCAVPEGVPGLPRAGVHAVRQGPYLAANLMASLRGGRLEEYIPQREALALLNLGDGAAVGTKWGLTFGGRSAMRWKDWIDRRFVRRFTLDDQGVSAH